MAKSSKRTRYTDDFRTSAVLYLEAAGYPNVPGALTTVSNRLDVPARTLSRWFNGESNPPPDKDVTKKRVDLVQMLRDEVTAALSEMNHARSEASYRDLGVVIGIAIDKLQLLSGQPTERVETIATMLDELGEDEYSAIVEEARAVITGSSSGYPGRSRKPSA